MIVLHILLLILKWIGIVLLVILGLLLLFIAIVLFSPIRYTISGYVSKEIEKIDMKATVSYIFPCIKCLITFKEKKLDGYLRILLKKFPFQETEDVKKKKQKKARKKKKTTIKTAENATKEETSKQIEVPKQMEVPKHIEAPKQIDALKVETNKSVNFDAIEKKEDTKEEKKEFFLKKWIKKIRELWNKLKAFKTKVFYTFHNFYDKITVLLEKKDLILEFIESEIHKQAFYIARDELFKLWVKSRPKKVRINAHIGFEDPFTTGNIMAGVAMFYPLFEGTLSIQPDFEMEVIEGNILLKGKIRPLHMVVAGLKLWTSKYIKRTYKDYNDLKEKIA